MPGGLLIGKPMWSNTAKVFDHIGFVFLGRSVGNSRTEAEIVSRGI